MLSIRPVFTESSMNFAKNCQANPTYKKALAIVKKYGYDIEDNCFYDKETDTVVFRVTHDGDKLDIYFEQNGNNPEFEVKTSSFGIIDLKELKHFIVLCNNAYNMCQELSKLDYRTLHIIEE